MALYRYLYIFGIVCRDERLPLVLWGKFAEDISDAVQLHSENTVICVLRFGKIKIWKGNFVRFCVLTNVTLLYSMVVTF